MRFESPGWSPSSAAVRSSSVGGSCLRIVGRRTRDGNRLDRYGRPLTEFALGTSLTIGYNRDGIVIKIAKCLGEV